MIPSLTCNLKALPLGRYLTTLEELGDHSFVQSSTHRQELFEEWATTTSALQELLPVASVWLGGSFFSAKAEPSDIECVYLVEHHHIDDIDEKNKPTLDLYRTEGALKDLGLRVDSQVVPWWPVDGPDSGGDRAESSLYDMGLWDSLLSKRRASQAELEIQNGRHGAIRRVGYLEVILDGYQEVGHQFPPRPSTFQRTQS